MKWLTGRSVKLPARLQALGWPGLAGLVALTVAAWLAWLGQHWEAQASALQAEVRQLRARVAPSVTQARPLNLQQWQTSLPSSAERQQRLADLLELAIRLELNGARTEHRLSSSEGLERLRVTMPVSGSYAQLRRFIAAALEHDPALSLDSIKLRRGSPMTGDVDAELQWSLHGRAAP